MDTVSKIVQLENGKKVISINGKETFFRGVQLRVDRYRNNGFMRNDELGDLFQHAKRIHTNVVQVILTWKEIEAEEGSFDFTNLKFAIDQCEKNDLLMEIVWFGGNVCGSGWKNFTPAWILEDEDRFWCMVDSDGVPVAKDYIHPFDGYKRTLCIENSEFIACEKKAVAATMQFVNEYDLSKRIVGFQVENEPSIVQHNPSFNMVDRCHCPVCNDLFDSNSYASALDFSKQRLVHYLNEIAGVVKSHREMITRVNWICCYWDIDEDTAFLKDNAPNIDFAGYDNYGCSVAHEYELMIGDYSQKDNVPFISEAAGDGQNQRERIWGALAANTVGYEVYQLAPATEAEDNCILDGYFESKTCAGLQVEDTFAFIEKLGNQLICKKAGVDIIYFNCGKATSQNCFYLGHLDGFDLSFSTQSEGIGCAFKYKDDLIVACHGKGKFDGIKGSADQAMLGYFDNQDQWVTTGTISLSNGTVLELDNQIARVHTCVE